MTFLSKTTVCEELLSLLSFVSNNKNSATGSEDELNKTIRFPYMACEVFSCEVNQITDTLVDGFVEDDNTMIMDDSSTAAQEFDSMASNDGSRDDVVFTDQNETIELDSKRDKTRLLDLFFNILLIHNEEEPIETLEELDDGNIPIINDRLAGYFEKVSFFINAFTKVLLTHQTKLTTFPLLHSRFLQYFLGYDLKRYPPI